MRRLMAKPGRTVLTLAAAASLLVAAGCGSDDDGGSSAGTDAPSDTDAPDGTDAPSGTTGGSGDCTLDEPLKIGYAADLGDLAGFVDAPGSQAAQVQVDLINDAGGVGGLPVEYVIKELPTDPSGAQRVAQELLDEGVDAIIAPPFAYNGVPLIDTVNGQVPIISNASTDLALVDPDRGAFLMTFSDPVQSAAAAELALGDGATTAVTLSSGDDPYFTNTTAAFTDAFQEGGGEVLGDYSYSLADEDFSSQVNAIAGLPTPPDVIYTALIMPGLGALLEQLDRAGLGDVPVIGADSFDATLVWTAGPVADGVRFTAHTFPRDGNRVQEFLDAADAAGVEIETVSFGALASDVVQVFAAAAEQACSVDGAALIETINNLENLEVTTDTITYAGTGGVPQRDVTILGVEGGEPVFVDAFQPSYVPS